MVWCQTIPQKGVQSITPEEMKAHVAYLASDEMKGRNTPSLELDTCAAYIAREFESYGLKPVGTNNSYHHTLFAMRTRLGDTNTLEVTSSQGTTPFRLKNDFVPLHVTANRKISELPVVFAQDMASRPPNTITTITRISMPKERSSLFLSTSPRKRILRVFLRDGDKLSIVKS